MLPLIWCLTIFLSFGSEVCSLGSMSLAAVSYGGNGQAFCDLQPHGSSLVTCFGTDAASVYGAPARVAFAGLTAGDGFICGLTLSAHQPYCWGNNIFVQQGALPLPGSNTTYASISAGDNHLCALKDPTADPTATFSVDCWGFNMTGSFIKSPLTSISSGSLFTCGLHTSNYTPICWGDETGSGIISKTPAKEFISISAGGYHVCGILRDTAAGVFCWGRVLDSGSTNIKDLMFSALAGGKFHECGLQFGSGRSICWGLRLPTATPTPKTVPFLGLVAGDYFTCGIAAVNFQPICWGSGYPSSLPVSDSPGICSPKPCKAGSYEYSNHLTNASFLCQNVSQDICVSCSEGCPPNMYVSTPCSSAGDRQCASCLHCNDRDCAPKCDLRRKRVSIQAPIIIGELSIAMVVIAAVFLVGFVWCRSSFRRDSCAGKEISASASALVQAVIKRTSFRSSFRKGKAEVWAHEELKVVSAYAFKYEELQKATSGFVKESEIGRGSFSCVYKGVLADGRVVAVKKPTLTLTLANVKDSKDFHNELELLSRLNHTHLLNLVGYCEEAGERLLVYEFMANGSLHEKLHGNYAGKLSWIRRVTVAVQAARGVEYLHGYACPPVIHRDIKSANILLDDDWNARVADFGLSLLGPPDSNTALSELPAGTLGYLDPEYYRLHYLTTKSDIYSFGVLLLEILSGRKAIDMQFDEGNIVEWAVPLIREGKIFSILDVRMEAPPNIEALHKIAKLASRCVRMRGKERPSMGKVTTALERALALLMGTPSESQLILPSEVVLGSNRLHRKGSQKSSVRRSGSEVGAQSCVISSDGEIPLETPVFASLTFPSVASSQQKSASKPSIAGSELPDNTRGDDQHCCVEIGPASPIYKDL